MPNVVELRELRVAELAEQLASSQSEVERLRGILHDAETTPLSEVATEMAALRENCAGVAALLNEATAEVESWRNRYGIEASTNEALRQRCANVEEARAQEATERDEALNSTTYRLTGVISAKAERARVLEAALDELLEAANNVLDLSGHASPVMHRHPPPCDTLSFCVQHHLRRALDRACAALRSEPAPTP